MLGKIINSVLSLVSLRYSEHKWQNLVDRRTLRKIKEEVSGR